MSYTKGQEFFSWKSQIVNILGFVRHKICHSNSTHCGTKPVTDNI